MKLNFIHIHRCLNLMSVSIIKLQKLFSRRRSLTILFITWFLYSAGLLGWMALNDTTPPHCFTLANEELL